MPRWWWLSAWAERWEEASSSLRHDSNRRHGCCHTLGWERWSGHCGRHVEVVAVVVVPWWLSPAWVLLHVENGCRSHRRRAAVVVVCADAAARPVEMVEWPS